MRPARPRPNVHLSVALSCLCVLVLAACSAGRPEIRIEAMATLTATATAVVAQPPSRPAASAAPRVAAPAGLADRVAPLLPALGLGAEQLTSAGEGDVLIKVSPAESDDPIVRRWIIVTDPLAHEPAGVTMADLMAAARAGRLFVGERHAGLVTPLLGGATPLPIEGSTLAGRVMATAGALAIVPEDRLTPGLRALALDGLDPVRHSPDRTSYPLVTRARVLPGYPSADLAALVAALRPHLEAEPAMTSVLFTGDLIPARCVYDQVRRAGDWSRPFRAIGDLLRIADITVGSLDAAISDRGTPIGCRETFSLLGPAAAAAGFAGAGFDVITVATNHVKDCGAVGPCGDSTFLDTLANLEAAGIRAAGGGRTLAEARRPALVMANGVRFAFLGYDDVAAHVHAGAQSPGTAPLDEATIAEDIAAARAVADVVVLLPQWGTEYTPDPTPRQKRVARLAIEAGVTLIAGNHPHVVQAAAPVGDGYVAYALGNFLFDQDWSVETTEGAILETTFHGARLAAVRLIPIRIEGRVEPVLLSGEVAARVLRRITAAARRLGE